MYPTEVVTIRNCSPTRQNRHKSGRCFDSLFLRPCPTTGYGLFNSLSNTNCHTSLSVFNGSYPRGFRPLVFGAAVSPRTTQASSSWDNAANFSERAFIAALVNAPDLMCAAAERALPSGVLGPLFLPPWWPHFWVRLVFSAGLPHCCLVRVDWAVHRKHRIRPPAVIRDSLIFRIVKLSAFRASESWSCNFKLYGGLWQICWR